MAKEKTPTYEVSILTKQGEKLTRTTYQCVAHRFFQEQNPTVLTVETEHMQTYMPWSTVIELKLSMDQWRRHMEWDQKNRPPEEKKIIVPGGGPQGIIKPGSPN